MFDYKLIVVSAIFASAFFAVDELPKLDHNQKMRSQIKGKISQLEEEISRRKKKHQLKK